MLELLKYQKPLVDQVLQYLPHGAVVLAASPGSGKTQMAIQVIIETLKANPNAKILVLAHGTTILRENFSDRIRKYFSDLSKEVVNSNDIDDSSVIVAIPQAFLKSKKRFKFDLLIVDEAHEYYFAKEYGVGLRSKLGNPQQLLLTGTHFRFTFENRLARQEGRTEPFKMVSITLNEIIDAAPERIAPMKTLVCQSCYDFREEDYNEQTQELKESVVFKKNDTEKTVEKVVKAILNILAIGPAQVQKLEKTMFACHSAKQAEIVYQYLTRIGVKTVISISDEEGVLKNTLSGTDQITKFKEDSGIQALVVIRRAILGYDHAELVNVVDLSGTRNIARIYQLMCRAVRAFPSNYAPGKEKLFIKIGPHGSGGHEYTLHLMSAVLMLNERSWYDNFDGRNFRELPIPSRGDRDDETRVRPTGERTPGSGGTGIAKPEMYLDVIASELLFEGTNDILVGNPAAKVGWTTLGAARSVLLHARINQRQAILDFCKNNGYLPNQKSSEQFESRLGSMASWLKKHDAQFCEEISIYKTWTEFQCDNNKRRFLQFCQEKGRKPTHHERSQLPNVYNYLNEKDVIFDAHFRATVNSYPNSVAHAAFKDAQLIREWMVKHKKPPSKDLKLPSGVAMKRRYNTLKKQMSNFFPTFETAGDKVRNKLEEILEFCIKNGFQPRRGDNSVRSEMSAEQNLASFVGDYKRNYKDRNDCEYSEKLHEIMQFPNGPIRSPGPSIWTLDACIENAKLYENRAAWMEHSVGACTSSLKNGWHEQCCSHMRRPITKTVVVVQVETDTVYSSLSRTPCGKDAAGNISRAIKNGKCCGGYHWAYYDEKIHGPIETLEDGTMILKGKKQVK